MSFKPEILQKWAELIYVRLQFILEIFDLIYYFLNFLKEAGVGELGLTLEFPNQIQVKQTMLCSVRHLVT